MRFPAQLGVCLLAATAAAGPGKRPDAARETAQQIERALLADDFIAVRAACSRGVALRSRYTPGQLEPVVKAVAAGIGHESHAIALLSVETLGKLRQKGSTQYLAGLLDVPAAFTEERYELHRAAIAAAAAIRDDGSVGKLEKLLQHRFTGIAVAAAEGLGRYRYLDRKPRLELIGRLATELDGLRKESAEAAEEPDREHAASVAGALVQTLRGLTGEGGISEPADVRSWLEKQRREEA